MQEDKACQEQEPSVGAGGEGQIEGAGQVKVQYRAYLLIVCVFFCFAQRRVNFCEKRAAPHSTCFSPPRPSPYFFFFRGGSALQ